MRRPRPTDMPLFWTITQPYFRVGIWRMEETSDCLFAMLPDGEACRAEALSRFSSPVRIREFAAVRALLHRMEPSAGPIAYHPSGRPWLPQSGLHLSVSHTCGYVAVMLSPRADVGVDIEHYAERIMKLRSRIVGPAEQARSCYEVLLHWSAKETAFKMMDCQEVDFLRHLCVSGLPEVRVTDEPQPGNRFRLTASHPACRRVYDVGFWAHADFVLTYSIEY